jgi:hypothetical protein
MDRGRKEGIGLIVVLLLIVFAVYQILVNIF